MPAKKIELILCAVRGVPQSRETVSYAIQLALIEQARLTFVHVNDAGFMASASPTMTSLSTVYKQMREMSEFAMLILCDRAKRRGVERVDYQILEGRLVEQIRSFLPELRPDILVIGKPIHTGASSSGTQAHELKDLIEEVKQQTKISVHTVDISYVG